MSRGVRRSGEWRYPAGELEVARRELLRGLVALPLLRQPLLARLLAEERVEERVEERAARRREPGRSSG